MNPNIYKWAIRHGVTISALQELQALFGLNGGTYSIAGDGVSESAVQASVRLEAARKGIRLFRNNVGALLDARGVPVRYGLANDSADLNKKIKSADLIGWRTIHIEPQHVGKTIAQFVSRECKKVGWQYKGDDHEKAQLAWLELVTAGGGDAAFTTGEIY